MNGPYADMAHEYLAAGWRGVLPVGRRPRLKKAPPEGYTGREGGWPTIETIDGWRAELGAVNVALRLPRGVVGIDVDDYDGKPGAATMQGIVAVHGSPGRTWKSTSRIGASGIRLYRVPEDIEFPDGLAGVDLIQYHDRYAVVAPSIHPEGRQYRWIDPDGVESGFPKPDELPDLPQAWLEHLSKTCACYSQPTGPVIKIRGASGDPVADELYEARAALAGGGVDGRHKGILRPVLVLLGYRYRGFPGAAAALEEIHGAFITAVTTPGHGAVRSEREAEDEWIRMTTEGKAATAGRGYPKWEPPYDDPGPTPEESAFEEAGRAPGEPHADPGPAPSPPMALPARLPAAFWTERPYLAVIKQAAWSRQRSPDAVFGAVLARVAAGLPHILGLPAIVGAEAGLSQLVSIVAPPGAGKSTAVGIADDLVPSTVTKIPSGSGEGLVEAMFEWVTIDDPVTGKPVKVKRQTRHNLLVVIDEGQKATRQASQASSTLFATWRSLFTGGMLGDANASAERNRIVDAGQYAIGLVAIFQPEALVPLFADLPVGTPSRFLYFAGTDPSMPDAPPAWPGTLPEVVPDLEHAKKSIDGTRSHHILVHIAVEAEIRAADLARQRGVAKPDAWAAHRNLLRLKVAALLAILDSRLLVTEDDWRLGGTVVDASDAVRKHAQAVIDKVRGQEESQTGKRLGRRAVAAEEMLEEHRVHKVAERLAEIIGERPGEYSRAPARGRLAPPQRAYFETALDLAVKLSWIEVRSDPGQGEEKVRLWPGRRRP